MKVIKHKQTSLYLSSFSENTQNCQWQNYDNALTFTDAEAANVVSSVGIEICEAVDYVGGRPPKR